MTKSVTVWTAIDELLTDDDGDTYASHTDTVSSTHECEGESMSFPGFLGNTLRIHKTAARQAADVIRYNYATFSNVCSDPYGARWAAAEPYSHPHENSIEYLSCTLEGFSPQEVRAIVRMVEWK